MRPIKFRAWDKKRKVWLWESGSIGESTTTGEVGGVWKLSTKKNVELMQYTGLKDSQGTEIYEGDIVHIVDGDLMLKGIVDMSKGAFGITGEHANVRFYTMKSPVIEVIGNIYENKLEGGEIE